MPSPSPARILEDARRLSVPLAPGAPGKLAALADMLADHALPLGLVATSDSARLWERHVLDCLRAATLLGPSDRTAYDLGSGAGLPGMVLAVSAPWCRFILVDANRRAAGFLELVAERLGLDNVEIAVARVESLDEPADLVTARAFAPLEAAWEAAYRLLRPGGRLVFFAGERMSDPEDAARGVAAPRAAEVTVVGGIEKSGPLVIMERSR